MWVLIFWWIKLMTASWDPAKMKEANKLLMWALIWIMIAIFSYAIVRIIVNLL
jgi:protein-S-isoprenylcysteine O-methyltransferase Ste14